MAHGEEGQKLGGVEAQTAGIRAEEAAGVDRGGEDAVRFLFQGLEIPVWDTGDALGVFECNSSGQPGPLQDLS
jgi:hypothetical protein